MKLVTYRQCKNELRRDDSIILLTKRGLTRLLCVSKSIQACELANYFGINIITRVEYDESETLKYITTVFKKEEYELQYKVPNTKYRIDLYFPKYKIAVECDEDHHKYQQKQDKKREDEIIEILRCSFIRYSPSDNIFKTIQRIYNKILKLVSLTSAPQNSA